MHRRTLVSVLAGALASATPSPARAQVAFDSPGGRVEILGLQRWTLRMLRDSVRSRVPGVELHDAACAVVLRDSLGFADASVTVHEYAPTPDAPVQRSLIIKLVEPQARQRVQWLGAPRDAYTVLRPEYAPVVLAVTDSDGGFWSTRILFPLQFYGRGTDARAKAMANVPATVRADADRLWTFLEHRRSDADWRRARRVLQHDGHYPNRLLAASVLASFPEHDSTWLDLTEALRDQHEWVRSAAAVVLRSFPSRPIDWAPRAETLRLLVGGTNVGATRDVLEVLARTDVSPTLAKQLLWQNDFWILSHLRAGDPGAAGSARALLMRLHGGKDLGPDDRAWARWIATL